MLECFHVRRRRFDFICLLLIVFTPIYAEDIDYGECRAPLGMENGLIQDEDISASSSHYPQSVGPQFGRINNETKGGAWCPSGSDRSQSEEWLQIELHQVYKITAVAVQGRNGNGQGIEFTSNISLQYYSPASGEMVPYVSRTGSSRLPGNSDTTTIVMTSIDPPIYTSKIRILPYGSAATLCLRLELYGCLSGNNLTGYTTPQVDSVNYEKNNRKSTYDQDENKNILYAGAGNHVDRDTQYNGVNQGKEILYQGEVDYFDIEYSFNEVRRFQAVQLHFKEDFTRFDQVSFGFTVFISTDGLSYSEVAKYSIVLNETALGLEPVVLKLKRQFGRYLKIHLHLPLNESPWNLINKIDIDSHNVGTADTWESTSINTTERKDDTIVNIVNVATWCEKNRALLEIIVVAVLSFALIIAVSYAIYLKIQVLKIKDSKSEPNQRSTSFEPLFYDTNSPMNGSRNKRCAEANSLL